MSRLVVRLVAWLALVAIAAGCALPVSLPDASPDGVVGVVVTVQDTPLPPFGDRRVRDGAVGAVHEDDFTTLAAIADLDVTALQEAEPDSGREVAGLGAVGRTDMEAAGGSVDELDDGEFALPLAPGRYLLCYLGGARRCFVQELGPEDRCRIVTGAGSGLICE